MNSQESAFFGCRTQRLNIGAIEVPGYLYLHATRDKPHGVSQFETCSDSATDPKKQFKDYWPLRLCSILIMRLSHVEPMNLKSMP